VHIIGRHKGFKNHYNSKQNQLDSLLSLKISPTAILTDACQVFDESPTPNWKSFPKFFNLEYFSRPIGLFGTSETGSEGGFNTQECGGQNMTNTDSNGFALNTDVKLLSKASDSTRCVLGKD